MLLVKGRLVGRDVVDFRDHKGSVLHCFSFPWDNSFSVIAELKAAMFAIDLAYSRSWEMIWLESDCMFVVMVLRERNWLIPWTLRMSWRRCLTQLRSMDFFGLSHIQRRQ